MYALKSAVRMPRSVQVEWEDGLRASFNYLWLQDNSPRRPTLVHLDLHTTPESIKCSPSGLNVVWPPFTNSDYSSRFLRENALTQRRLEAEASRPSTSSAQPALPSADLGAPTRLTDFFKSTVRGAADHAPITHVVTGQRVKEEEFEALRAGEIMAGTSAANGEEIWALVDAADRTKHFMMSATYWNGAAREPGTLWSQLPIAPSICTAESAVRRPTSQDTPPIISVVDAAHALSLLAKRNPQAYDCLSNHYLSYSDGWFRARHAACYRGADGQLIPGTFNNGTRSTALTAGPIEQFYASLQQLGRIFSELTRFVHVPFGKRLIVDNRRAMMGMPSQSGRRILVRCVG